MTRWRFSSGERSREPEARSRGPGVGRGKAKRRGDGMAAATFRDLKVFQKAHQFVLDVYELSAHFPRSEMFGLTSQLRRAAISIPANIAEGFVKRGVSDKLRFYNIAQGSLEECRYY